MNQPIRFLGILCAFFFLPFLAQATHNRAGEIHIRQIGPLTIEATIITWTKASSVNADRDTLTICWGDGVCINVPRSNGGGNGVVFPNDIKYNLYVSTHTYSGPAEYRISMTDPNRIAGIINVNPPSSDNVPFHIETIYSFQDPQFGGNNTTPYLLQPPIDNACVGKTFKHNPNAFDPDGDSLSYQLIIPLQSLGSNVPNYSYPNAIGPGSNNVLQLDPVSGDLLWSTPQVAGEYNLAFIIVSWRNGNPIDTTIRDMQIFVDDCDNNPPTVQTIDELCVVAGQFIQFPVRGTDPDENNFVQLTALGGPFSTVYSPATFTAPTGFAVPPVIGTFRWQTTCEHISNQPYSVVFKALDSLNKNTPKLADLKTVQIKVVGPPPEDVEATAQLGEVDITWLKPYFCENAADDYFYGFSVWRREGSNDFPLDSCDPGLEGKGYQELVFVTKTEQNGRYYYKDTNVERGRTYCYRILGKFARISSGGYAYNLVDGLASKEVCVQLPRDLPLITNVSVLETSTTTGRMDVRWAKPLAGDLDTVLNPGPYRYQVQRATGFTGGTFVDLPGANFITNLLWLSDTLYEDQNLNTQDGPYRYRIAFYVNTNPEPLGYTNDASSVYLSVASTDNTNNLSWLENVPWENYSYTIFRRPGTGGPFEQIGTSTIRTYADKGLVNGKEYCYYVQSEGTYSITGIASPLLNNSQEDCGIPIDTMPPCKPTLSVGNLCNDLGGPAPDPPYENNLTWTNPNTTCANTDDAIRYNVWFAPDVDQETALLTTNEGANNITFVHSIEEGLAGCYEVSAIDSNGNESLRSNKICVDNCPQYELPNVFTPNGDGFNELFVPFPGWRFIDRIDIQIFNRWGNLVFSSTDPAILWDGKNLNGDEVAEGAYFYVCRVYENRVDGVVLRDGELSGFIEVVRGGR